MSQFTCLRHLLWEKIRRTISVYFIETLVLEEGIGSYFRCIKYIRSKETHSDGLTDISASLQNAKPDCVVVHETITSVKLLHLALKNTFLKRGKFTI